MKGKWDKVIVGYDLDDVCSQISYCYSREEQPETLSVVAGEENYSIPTVLCKRKNVNQWYYGKEAVRYAAEEGVLLIENLVSKALSGEEVVIEGTPFHSAALLTLFVKRSLGLLSLTAGTEQIGALMITCRNLTSEMVAILNTVAAGLSLKTECISFQSYIESIYFFLLHQPEELWKNQVAVYDCSESDMTVYRMECNRHTTPVVAFIHTGEYTEDAFSFLSGEQKDAKLLRLAQRVCAEYPVQTSYLIGEGFDEEWLQESLKFLCRNKRLFKGNNLYSKGACHAMKEKLAVSDIGKRYVFLGEEKLKANIGMQVLKQGKNSYYALLDAGVNWYEAQKECEFILESGTDFELIVTPLNGTKAANAVVSLEGIPKRPDATTRLAMRLDMPDADRIRIIVTDLGFGEIFPSSKLVFTREILLN